MSPARILIVEDDQAHAEALRIALETEGYAVESAETVDGALDRLRARSFDLVLTDLRLGGPDGIDLLREARRVEPGLSVFLITGHGSVETAVRAMREGAADYLTKPVNIVELRTRVARELEKRRLSADNEALRAELDQRFGLEGMVGNSVAMQPIFDVIRQAGPTDATVLILGESGTGKELVARSLHRLSRRRRRRFVAVNCAALADTLIESELFGHVRGAFTGAQNSKDGRFEYANGGTLFLDEIGDMPAATQAKLLRVLEDRAVIPVGANEERPVDVRILAATNHELEKRVSAGQFRADLYYRLAVMRIELPPLRERLEDLPLLVDHFRREFAERHGKTVKQVSEEVLARLRSHSWPGNVRELRNVLETMVVLDRDGELGVDDLPVALRAALPSPSVQDPRSPSGETREVPSPDSPSYSLLGHSLKEVERDLIAVTLEAVGHNRQQAAERLGIGERTLYRKIKEYGL